MSLFTVIPFHPAHLKALVLQPHQAFMGSQVASDGYGQVLADAPGVAYTGMADGRIIACAGVMEIWAGRGAAWAFLAQDKPETFRQVHRAVKLFLDSSAMTRIEAYVDTDFPAAYRWMKLLGFERETPAPMRAFAGSRDMYLYARVNDG